MFAHLVWAWRIVGVGCHRRWCVNTILVACGGLEQASADCLRFTSAFASKPGGVWTAVHVGHVG